MSLSTSHPAIVLGMFETGLGVARSLGRNGIPVFGFDCKTDVGFHSRYLQPVLCPHPIEQEQAFIEFLIDFGARQSHKPVLFITADDFLVAVSKNRERLRDGFLFNLPERATLDAISDKYLQYQLAQHAHIEAPRSWQVASLEELTAVLEELPYPLFIKAVDVNSWRARVSRHIKGFVVQNQAELEDKVRPVLEASVRVLLQEVITGPDTSHVKFCGYVNQNGELQAAFTLRKIRQKPIHFGVGSAVESIVDPDLVELGARFFSDIGYRGVGSAEFKRDAHDGRLKLIELNPRYWQQNALAERCGVNFPLYQYLDLTGQKPPAASDYAAGIKWINMYMDFSSFRAYRKQGELSLSAWLKSLSGAKMLSDFSADDINPGLHKLAGKLRLAAAGLFSLAPKR